MTKLSPFHPVLDRMLALSRAMDGSFAQEAGDSRYSTTAPQGVWFPALDCYETNNTFVIDVDVPGVRPEDVDISFEQNALTIKGSRPSVIRMEESADTRVFASERTSGEFSRAIRLPEYVDGERIDARYANGVLTVTIPKAASALPRKVAVKVHGRE